MHTLLLVTLSMPEGAASENARRRAHDLLIHDDSFCGEGGRFGVPLCDWFVLGGRWSGMLREKVMGQPYQDALKLEFPDLTIPSSLVETHKTSIDQLWRHFGGTGASPLARSGYDHLGSDDDAMIVDQLLYDHFLKPHDGSEKNVGGDDFTDFADLDGEDVDESFIGRKWLVVVDYHN